jgi:propionyl-CoA carboxylase alpha chain
MPTIGTLLVANRGEIASRVFRSARELGLRTVAVFSDPDARAPFVREADIAVRLSGSSPQETYLQIDRVIDAAKRTGADAIHPGYGFLSENARFAEACADAGIVFVGPPVAAIEAMGSKVAAKQRMQQAGVPVLPSMTVEPDNLAELETIIESIGVPALVKASFGGGGRGMRIVRDPAKLQQAALAASREAKSAFGDGAIFLERYLEQPRHVEVQIFGDSLGNVVSLFERDCSIQRRYQKIVEEAPSPGVDEELRKQLSDAAVAAGRAIGYEGAGTVEFLLDEDRQFYFLEVNTRLQVEHPVTEMVTGLDLVDLQLRVASGEPLPSEVYAAQIAGAAIEVRLYAEDVNEGFLPDSGRLHRFKIPAGPGVRVDSGVEDGSIVSVHYDAMIAKVIAHGRDRQQACSRLALTLENAQLHGVITNRDLLVGILRETEFVAGKTDTAYLERHDPTMLGKRDSDEETLRIHAIAAVLVAQHRRRREAGVLATLPSGWRNVPSQLRSVHVECRGEDINVRYRIDGDHVTAVVNDISSELIMTDVGDRGIGLEVEGTLRWFSVHRVAGQAFVDSSMGSTVFSEPPRFPDPSDTLVVGSMLAPMPATIIHVDVEVGDRVEAGDVVLLLEAMKMEHAVEAPYAGVVSELDVTAGETVDTGTVLAVIDGDNGEGA